MRETSKPTKKRPQFEKRVNVTQMHLAGYELPTRGDGLHWLRCTECGREWAEKDSGAFAKGSRTCPR